MLPLGSFFRHQRLVGRDKRSLVITYIRRVCFSVHTPILRLHFLRLHFPKVHNTLYPAQCKSAQRGALVPTGLTWGGH
jgi:hypothetical protein